jgi:small-conductance mechanosensitive channel
MIAFGVLAVLAFLYTPDFLAVRGLSVAARRLAWQRAQARRDTAVAEGAEGTPLEEPTLAIEQVNQQSLRLIRLGLFAGLLAVLWWVWADLLTVFAYLDTVTLYEFTSGSGATASQVPITLLDLIGALLTVAITLILARNLPGAPNVKTVPWSDHSASVHVAEPVGTLSMAKLLRASWSRAALAELLSRCHAVPFQAAFTVTSNARATLDA